MTASSSTAWPPTSWPSRATATSNGSRATSRTTRRTRSAASATPPSSPTASSSSASSGGEWQVCGALDKPSMICKHLKAATILGALVSGSPLTARCPKCGGHGGQLLPDRRDGGRLVHPAVARAAGSSIFWPTAPMMKNRKAHGSGRTASAVSSTVRAYDKRPAFAFKRCSRGRRRVRRHRRKQERPQPCGLRRERDLRRGNRKRRHDAEANVAVRRHCTSAPPQLALGHSGCTALRPGHRRRGSRRLRQCLRVRIRPRRSRSAKLSRRTACGPTAPTHWPWSTATSPISELEGRTFRYVRSR